MPTLKHKTPCPGCPFRRASAPGHLGTATPAEFLRSTMGEEHMPCHLEIDYEEEDWFERQYPDAALCAGALIFLRNTCKLPRDPALAAATRAVEPDRRGVFSNPAQFQDHHGRFR